MKKSYGSIPPAELRRGLHHMCAGYVAGCHGHTCKAYQTDKLDFFKRIGYCRDDYYIYRHKERFESVTSAWLIGYVIGRDIDHVWRFEEGAA